MSISYEEVNDEIVRLIYHGKGKNKYSTKIFTLPKFLIDMTKIKSHKPCKICKEADDIITKRKKEING